MGREGKEFKIEDGVLKWLNEDGTVASDDKMLDIRKRQQFRWEETSLDCALM